MPWNWREERLEPARSPAQGPLKGKRYRDAANAAPPGEDTGAMVLLDLLAATA